MQSSVFIAHPTSASQINALKAIVKAFNVPFEIKKEIDAKSNKSEIIKNIKQGFKEMKLIEEGKLKGTSFKEFLNEL